MPSINKEETLANQSAMKQCSVIRVPFTDAGGRDATITWRCRCSCWCRGRRAFLFAGRRGSSNCGGHGGRCRRSCGGMPWFALALLRWFPTPPICLIHPVLGQPPVWTGDVKTHHRQRVRVLNDGS